MRRADLCEGVVVWRPPVGLLDELTVHLVLQLRVGQAHLQSSLGQRGVVVDRRRLDQHVDEELTRLTEEGNDFLIQLHCQQVEANTHTHTHARDSTFRLDLETVQSIKLQVRTEEIQNTTNEDVMRLSPNVYDIVFRGNLRSRPPGQLKTKSQSNCSHQSCQIH